ncbi:MAG: MazG-like family protein, partial [Longicatena sp.]
IVIEAAELLECFQWDDNKYDKKHVCEELADVMNYCILLADKLNVDMEEIILDKIKQNEVKYPVEKAKGKSNKYDEL